MAISPEALRAILAKTVEESPQKKGLVLTIQVKAMDNGGLYIGGEGVDDRPIDGEEGWTGVGIAVAQLVNGLHKASDKRRNAK
ncbi:hypothetical protein [Actinopolymorpha pittospori]|uniref:Uncharacterized protein n=1 Tax=Actinopolymorpha pittospori TaxID=648752 RepID=A0A927N3W6_9ACTN|nr:hypothetical protein [Actinopolymorpha pittospori]MBE1608110.1 hypothetical protein [Actinopolymorpha pittospori]